MKYSFIVMFYMVVDDKCAFKAACRSHACRSRETCDFQSRLPLTRFPFSYAKHVISKRLAAHIKHADSKRLAAHANFGWFYMVVDDKYDNFPHSNS
jgi:hypothetical protein